MSEHNDDRTRTFGARAPSVTPTAVHVTEIREWREKRDQNYNKLVTFVRELSQAQTNYMSWYRVEDYAAIDGHWAQDAKDLLSTIEN